MQPRSLQRARLWDTRESLLDVKHLRHTGFQLVVRGHYPQRCSNWCWTPVGTHSGWWHAGSASATAAGMVPFAIGTETCGSITSPANQCGVTGLRPSFGAVGRSGVMALAPSLVRGPPLEGWCNLTSAAAIPLACSGAMVHFACRLTVAHQRMPVQRASEIAQTYVCTTSTCTLLFKAGSHGCYVQPCAKVLIYQCAQVQVLLSGVLSFWVQ